MTDLLGVPLNIGDEIIYTTGAQGRNSMERGFIVDIRLSKNGYARDYYEALIKTASGRTATNWRSSLSLVSVKPIKAQHPELFI